MSDEATMTIDGVAASTEATFDVVNPATGAPEATAPDCTPQQLDAAMASAAKAYRDWRQDEGRRRDLLRRSADALMAAANDIAPILTLEQGEPPHQPFGGAKWSGIGVENGTWGLLASASPRSSTARRRRTGPAPIPAKPPPDNGSRNP